MVKCDFPGCNTNESMPFRCDRCNPPKYYCVAHKLPPNHNCLGMKEWKTTKSPVSDIAIGYEKSASIKVIGGSGYFTSEEKTTIITQTPTSIIKVTKPWYSTLKDKIKKIFGLK